MTSKLPIRLGILGVLLQLFGFAPASVFAQNPPTFADDIAPIIYIHCTPCHRTGEIGRFPLTTYQEVSAWAVVIRNVTQTRYMPPWKADPAYRSFLGENYLTNTQIQKRLAKHQKPKGQPFLPHPKARPKKDVREYPVPIFQPLRQSR